ncbi:hypothetical protein FRC06_003789 [Ceratobasidium sp. 370]|nr:hypothetical protein FRC06_003789 [Ceratobasidium sp. 370]
MEVNEAPPVDRCVCFCCNYLVALNARLAAEAHQGDNNPDVGNGNMGLEDVDMGNGEDTGPEVDEDLFAGLALDRNDDPPIPLPNPAPPHEVRWNPPVRIDDWPELGSDHESEAEDIDEGPADGPV